jgi:excisionase family DNA binding protein
MVTGRVPHVRSGKASNDMEKQEMQRTEVTQEWVSYPDAEKYCGLSHTTLWRLVSSRQIKAARVGRSVRIHLPSLKRFMEERAAEEGSPTTGTAGLMEGEE